MNQDFWLRLAFSSLLIVGVWNAFGKGMILDKAGDWLEKTSPWIGKPFGLCPPCMASVYGTACWFGTGGGWLWWIPFVLALSGTMKLITVNLLKND